MTLLLFVYFAQIVDKIILGAELLFIFLSAILVGASIFKISGGLDEFNVNFSLKPLFITWIIVMLVSAFTPNSKTLYILAGVKYGQEIMQNENVQEISKDVLKIIELKIKSTKEELEKELEKEAGKLGGLLKAPDKN